MIILLMKTTTPNIFGVVVCSDADTMLAEVESAMRQHGVPLTDFSAYHVHEKINLQPAPMVQIAEEPRSTAQSNEPPVVSLNGDASEY